MTKANLLIEVMSLSTSIAMLAPKASLLPSAECYAPCRWRWSKNNSNNKTTENKHQSTPKSHSFNSLKPLIWNSWCLQIWVLKVTLTQSPHLPWRAGYPKARQLWRRCPSQPVLGENMVVLSQWAPSPLPSSMAQPRHLCRLWGCSQHRHCLAVGRVDSSGRASLAQVVAKARVVSACVIVRMTV